MNNLKALLNASDDSGGEVKERKMHEYTTRLGCKIHLSDLKLHTAEALVNPARRRVGTGRSPDL